MKTNDHIQIYEGTPSNNKIFNTSNGELSHREIGNIKCRTAIDNKLLAEVINEWHRIREPIFGTYKTIEYGKPFPVTDDKGNLVYTIDDFKLYIALKEDNPGSTHPLLWAIPLLKRRFLTKKSNLKFFIPN